MILADFKHPVQQRPRARHTYPSGLFHQQDMDTVDKQMVNEGKKIVTTERGTPRVGLGDKQRKLVLISQHFTKLNGDRIRHSAG